MRLAGAIPLHMGQGLTFEHAIIGIMGAVQAVLDLDADK